MKITKIITKVFINFRIISKQKLLLVRMYYLEPRDIKMNPNQNFDVYKKMQ